MRIYKVKEWLKNRDEARAKENRHIQNLVFLNGVGNLNRVISIKQYFKERNEMKLKKCNDEYGMYDI